MDNSDLILNIGAKLTDSATAGFSYQFNIDDVVMLNHHNIKIDDVTNDEDILPSLLKQLSNIFIYEQCTFPCVSSSNITSLYCWHTTIINNTTYFKMMIISQTK